MAEIRKADINIGVKDVKAPVEQLKKLHSTIQCGI